MRQEENEMKTIRRHYKVLLLCLFVLLTCSACSNPRGTDGKTKVDQIIASEKIEISKSQVNIEEVSDPDLKEKLTSESGDTVTIEPTTWASAWHNGWFDGLIVWPIAQLINVLASFTDAGWGIILTTLLIQLLIYLLTYKSQLSQQRMQELQPEMQRIQNKYAGKNDERSRMLMAQETQKLYTENDIHPFGSILVMFIQLPVMMGMFYATMRAATTVYGSFMGMPLSETPLGAFANLDWGPIIVYALMIIMSIVSMQLPKWMNKMDQKKKASASKSKFKKQEEKPQGGMMANTMNMTMYMTTAMVAFMYISWPIAMSFYWLVSSVIRSGMSVISHFVSNKKAEAKAAAAPAYDSGILKNRKK